MRKLLIGALGALLMMLGFVGGAQAEPGPNGNNDHGLCTAYFNGQKNGHGDGQNPDRQPGPFQALEDTGREYTDNDGADNDNDGETDEEGENESLTGAENVFNYCNDLGLIGGNPDHGRFTCTDSGDTDPSCEDNEGPGNS